MYCLIFWNISGLNQQQLKNKMMKLILVHKHIMSSVSLFFMCSFLLVCCRANDTENSLESSGSEVAFSIHVKGSGYLKVLEESGKFERSLMLDKSTVLISRGELGLSDRDQVKGSFYTGETALSLGVKYRVLVYDSSEKYVTHKDYRVGDDISPVMLNSGHSYTLVLYSYNSQDLPPVSSLEQSGLEEGYVMFDNSNRDFMYHKEKIKPLLGISNQSDVLLIHQVPSLRVNLVSGIPNSLITGVDRVLVTPDYKNGKFSLSQGHFTGQSDLSEGVSLVFANQSFPTQELQSAPVFINSGPSSKSSFAARVMLGGESRGFSFSDFIRLSPGYHHDITLELSRCGAYLGAGNSLWRDFMCANLGANEKSDPFVGSTEVHGSKYQWGSAEPILSPGMDQSVSGVISGWNSVVSATGSWNSGSESVPVKSGKDPCPEGYRIPSRQEWQQVQAHNPILRTGVWTSSPGNYSSGVRLGKYLFLPAIGYRRFNTGALESRGSFGIYWSSTELTASGAYGFVFSSKDALVGFSNRSYGSGVRCIAE